MGHAYRHSNTLVGLQPGLDSIEHTRGNALTLGFGSAVQHDGSRPLRTYQPNGLIINDYSRYGS